MAGNQTSKRSAATHSEQRVEGHGNRFVKTAAYRDEFVAAGGYGLPSVRPRVETESGGSWTERLMLSNRRLAKSGMSATGQEVN